MPLVIPELIIKGVLDGALLSLDHDIKNTVRKEDTILYQIYGDLAYPKFKYFEEAAKLFRRSNGQARQIMTKLSFDGDISNMPTIHITNAKDSPNAQGIGRVEESQLVDRDKRTTQVNWVRFSAETNLVMTSNSLEELQLMYNTIRSLMIACSETLLLSGIDNIRFGGADVMLTEDMAPKSTYIKALSINYEYDIIIPSMIRGMLSASSLSAAGTPIPTTNQ